MARCINTRPLASSDRNEEKVFRYLSALGDDWLVVWGYRYVDERGETREGDFLVLGPQGGLMVIEVKGRDNLMCTHDGHWVGGPDNPFQQLDAQWSAVIHEVNRDAGLRRLTVCRALAVPNIRRTNLPQLPQLAGGDSLVMAQEDLAAFTERWDATFRRFRFYPDATSRELFFQSPWGHGFTAEAGGLLSDYFDLEIDRLTRASFPVLDHLPSYSRFAITGPAGSGKTWMLLELALRWAGRDGGEPRDVLLLCYNKALERDLAGIIRRLSKGDKQAKRAAERIHVRSWESIVCDVMTAIGIGFDPPANPDAKTDYFRHEVPAALSLALENACIVPHYDALVVDEGQDHNTSAGDLRSVWWSLYLGLLRQPETALIAVAYDTRQRPPYWDSGTFNEEQLLALLGPEAVRIHCPTPHRYTRQIAGYLNSLAARLHFPFECQPAELARLPDAFAVLEQPASLETTAATVDSIASTWISEGLAAPEEILIIGLRNDRGYYGLGDTCAGHPLVAVEERTLHQLSYISAGRCKGLESLAVILVGLGDPETLSDGFRHSYFLAASRVRQHLAVVTLK